MEFHKREKLYKQMLENPNELVQINKNNFFLNLNNKINQARMRIFDVTEFLNLLNTLFMFYVVIKSF